MLAKEGANGEAPERMVDSKFVDLPAIVSVQGIHQFSHAMAQQKANPEDTPACSRWLVSVTAMEELWCVWGGGGRATGGGRDC